MYFFFRLRNFILGTLLFGGIFLLALVQSGEFAVPVSTTSPPKSRNTVFLTGFGDKISVSADSALLMDAQTGTVLYAKNEFVHRAPASTTKMLTAILALEKGNLNSVVKVDRSATGVGGSQIWLEPDEELTLLHLLQGLMLKSGNDAAVAVAQHIAGSVANFSEIMNQRARELGAFDSVFSNPNGLPEKTKPHYSCAYDLALLARRGLQIPVFREIVRTKYEEIPWGNHDWERRLTNTNRLLWYFSGADGVKTGTTRAAGNCLVASATRDGLQLIAVVLHANDRWQDAAKLLEYGFRTFRPLLAFRHGTTVNSVPVRNGIDTTVDLIPYLDICAVVPISRWKDVEFRVTVPEYLTAPFWSGEEVGLIQVVLGGIELASGPLVTASPVGRRTFWPWR